eukprot:gnl/MRDRNA2_/MRDRNA2_117773_c0_seq1.p1 gnl/MRDRNA2_/MRDRNA2_117773_c0~~gnl/MRDRNA2_/MRDRNA2_117773_c0_seq1.p1  ORF type:complete len:1287 (+),score=280.33 gnl/MRDRNA2_/MRDRNA2_117773_c0_seq1:234-3863(+)
MGASALEAVRDFVEAVHAPGALGIHRWQQPPAFALGKLFNEEESKHPPPGLLDLEGLSTEGNKLLLQLASDSLLGRRRKDEVAILFGERTPAEIERCWEFHAALVPVPQGKEKILPPPPTGKQVSDLLEKEGKPAVDLLWSNAEGNVALHLAQTIEVAMLLLEKEPQAISSQNRVGVRPLEAILRRLDSKCSQVEMFAEPASPPANASKKGNKDDKAHGKAKKSKDGKAKAEAAPEPEEAVPDEPGVPRSPRFQAAHAFLQVDAYALTRAGPEGWCCALLITNDEERDILVPSVPWSDVEVALRAADLPSFLKAQDGLREALKGLREGSEPEDNVALWYDLVFLSIYGDTVAFGASPHDPLTWKHTPKSCKRLGVVWECMEMLLKNCKDEQAQSILRALLTATQGPNGLMADGSPFDPRKPYREALTANIAGQVEHVEKTLRALISEKGSPYKSLTKVPLLESHPCIDDPLIALPTADIPEEDMPPKSKRQSVTSTAPPALRVDRAKCARLQPPQWVLHRDLYHAVADLRAHGCIQKAGDLFDLIDGTTAVEMRPGSLPEKKLEDEDTQDPVCLTLEQALFAKLHCLWLKGFSQSHQASLKQRIGELIIKALPDLKVDQPEGAPAASLEVKGLHMEPSPKSHGNLWSAAVDKLQAAGEKLLKSWNMDDFHDFIDAVPRLALWPAESRSTKSSAALEWSTPGASICDLNAASIVLATSKEAVSLHHVLKGLTWENDKALLLRTESTWHANALIPASGYRDVTDWLLIEADGSPHVLELHIASNAFFEYKGMVNLCQECQSGEFDHPALSHLWSTNPAVLWNAREARWHAESQELRDSLIDARARVARDAKAAAEKKKKLLEKKAHESGGLGGGTLEKSKFKSSDDFRRLQECMTLFKGNLPYCSRNFPDQMGYMKLKQFWDNCTGLAESQNVDMCGHIKKDHIQLLHFAKNSEPLKRVLPTSMHGFDIEIIKAAQASSMNSTLPRLAKGEVHTKKFDKEELKDAATTFLGEVDNFLQKITDVIQPHVRNGFAAGLEKLRNDVEEVLTECNGAWVKFETEYFQEALNRLMQAISIEAKLGDSELKKNMGEIAQYESEFMEQCGKLIEEFCQIEGAQEVMKDAIALAEASILMEHEHSWAQCAQQFLKQVLRLRICLVKIGNAENELKNEDENMLQRVLVELSEIMKSVHDHLTCAASLPRPREHGRILNQW